MNRTVCGECGTNICIRRISIELNTFNRTLTHPPSENHYPEPRAKNFCPGVGSPSVAFHGFPRQKKIPESLPEHVVIGRLVLILGHDSLRLLFSRSPPFRGEPRGGGSGPQQVAELACSPTTHFGFGIQDLARKRMSTRSASSVNSVRRLNNPFSSLLFQPCFGVIPIVCFWPLDNVGTFLACAISDLPLYVSIGRVFRGTWSWRIPEQFFGRARWHGLFSPF